MLAWFKYMPQSTYIAPQDERTSEMYGNGTGQSCKTSTRWLPDFFSSFFGALRRAGHTLDAMLCTFRNPAEQSQKFGLESKHENHET
jgi:hypothetical protein